MDRAPAGSTAALRLLAGAGCGKAPGDDVTVRRQGDATTIDFQTKEGTTKGTVGGEPRPCRPTPPGP